MSAPGKILIVDDDEAFLATYRDLLGAEGYAVESVSNRKDALARLDAGGWDIVLLDQKLRGSDGPDDGVDLLDEVQIRTPGAKPMIVTAYAAPEVIERAFTLGAYDYLEKGRNFTALLRAKVRNASEVVRERRLGALDPAGRESELRSAWTAAI